MESDNCHTEASSLSQNGDGPTESKPTFLFAFHKHCRYDRNDIERAVVAINDVLVHIISAGGTPYGGYVRDVLVPLRNGIDVKSLNFKDVDIWWKSQDDIDAFFKSLPKESVFLERPALASDEEKFCIENYTWPRKQYYFQYSSCIIATSS